MKKFLNYLLLFALVVAISELLFGYAIFQKLNKDKQNNYYSSIYKVGRYLYVGYKMSFPYIEKLDNSGGVYPVNLKKKLLGSDYIVGDNIYITKNPYKDGYKFHPFIDFTNAHGHHNFDNDFFGYRNRFDYGKANDKNEFRILMTGGSECAGHSHNLPISFLLEKNLREHYSSQIRVLNFCMNGYTLPYEIQTFVHLGWTLEPHLVISHTGWNDAFQFPFMPETFGKLGLTYALLQEEWMDILYSLETSEVFELKKKGYDSLIRNYNQEMFIDSIKKTLKKYNKLVNSSGSDFLIGIQPWNTRPHTKAVPRGKFREMLYANVEMLKNQADYFKMNVINFAKNNAKYQFKDDSIHTTPASAQLIADEYFLYIKENYNDKIASIINLEN